jgi:nucleoside 2-deoxyribosyltransferase
MIGERYIMNIFSCSPLYKDEEIYVTKKFNEIINGKGYNTYSPFFEEKILYAMNEDKLDFEKMKTLSCLSFAIDIFYMTDMADCFIGNLNGRVPDESTIIKLGIAYIIGLAVFLYKNDSRIAFVSGDNSMILGL